MRHVNVVFKHGTIRSGKTLDLISTHFNLTQSGKRVIVVKPSFDTRFSKDKVVSRGTNVALDCELIDERSDLSFSDVDYILVDEAQFLTRRMVRALYAKASTLDAELVFYGLLRDYNGNLFTGTSEVIAVSTSLQEIASCCEAIGCRHKATHHLLYQGGGVVYGEGDGLKLGDGEYRSVCCGHYLEAVGSTTL